MGERIVWWRGDGGFGEWLVRKEGRENASCYQKGVSNYVQIAQKSQWLSRYSGPKGQHSGIPSDIPFGPAKPPVMCIEYTSSIRIQDKLLRNSS